MPSILFNIEVGSEIAHRNIHTWNNIMITYTKHCERIYLYCFTRNYEDADASQILKI